MTSGAYIRQHNYTSVDVPECNMLKRWQRTRQMVITYENTGSRVPIVENRSQSFKNTHGWWISTLEYIVHLPLEIGKSSN